MPGLFKYYFKFRYLMPLFLVIINCSCTQPGKEDHRTLFRYNESAGITSLDPAFCSRTENIWAVNQIFNGLVQLNDSLQIKPCIARKWDISDSGRVYTFYLRKDVFFHPNHCFKSEKGRRVNASDFVYSLCRLADQSTASPGAWIMERVSIIDNKPQVSALNDSVVQIVLKQAFRPFLNLLSMPYACVVPHEAIQYYGPDFRSNPVGTGPFKFKLWQEGEKLILLKNTEYFEKFNGDRLPYIDAVNVSFIKDRQTAFLEFIKGNFEFMSGVDASYKDEILTRSGKLSEAYRGKINMSALPYLKTDYLGFNLEDKTSAFNDRRLRRALNFAIDRDKMLIYLRNKLGKPALSGFSPGFLRNNLPVKGSYSYNPDSVKALLSEAGFPDGKNLPELKLVTTSVYQDVCEYIASASAQFGIRIKVEVLTSAVNSELIAHNKVPFWRKSWVGDYADAENFLSVFYSGNFSPDGPNYTHFRHKEYDALYEKLCSNISEYEEKKLVSRMEEILLNESPFLLLYYDEAVFFYHNHVKNLKGNGMNLLNLKKVKIQY